MKKGIIALALVFGLGYGYSQDTTSMARCAEQQGSSQGVNENQDLGAADTLSQESTAQNADTSYQSDEFAREEDYKNEEDFNNATAPELSKENQASIESEEPSDVYSEQDTSTMNESEVDMNKSSCDTTMNQGAYVAPEDTSASTAMSTETNVKVDVDDEGTLENIVEAPFKFIGTVASQTGEGVGHIVGAPIKGGAKAVKGIAKGTVSVVSEVGEGVGHIVAAPFIGVAKLFGAGKDDEVQDSERGLKQQNANANADIKVETDVDTNYDTNM